MQEGVSTSETWPFECLHCLRVWEEEYLVRRVSDEHGHDVVVWTRNGAQVQPPWSGTSCPFCGYGSVTTFPTGYAAHHPSPPQRAAAAHRPGPADALPPTGGSPPAGGPPGSGTSAAPVTSSTLLVLALLFAGLEKRVPAR